jgi:hypothetical protein
MQVNVWVHVADPSSFAWHSKEFMAPVIAPAEADLAWRPLLPSFESKAACSLCAPSASPTSLLPAIPGEPADPISS